MRHTSNPPPPAGFWQTLFSRWKVLLGLVVTGFIPWLMALLRDWLAQIGIEWAWSFANPQVAAVLNWMAANPVSAAVMGAVVWLLVMATASHFAYPCGY
jgi:hypothetical protein